MHIYTQSNIHMCICIHTQSLSLSIYIQAHTQSKIHVNIDIYVCTHIHTNSHLYMESIYKYTNIPILCEYYIIMYIIKHVCAKTQDRERDMCMCVCVCVHVISSTLSFIHVFESFLLHVLMTSTTITPECLVLPQQWW